MAAWQLQPRGGHCRQGAGGPFSRSSRPPSYSRIARNPKHQNYQTNLICQVTCIAYPAAVNPLWRGGYGQTSVAAGACPGARCQSGSRRINRQKTTWSPLTSYFLPRPRAIIPLARDAEPLTACSRAFNFSPARSTCEITNWYWSLVPRRAMKGSPRPLTA